MVVVATGALLATNSAGATAAAGQGDVESTRSALAARLVAGTAVGIDTVSGKVVLTISAGAPGAGGLLAAAKGYGSAVRVQHAPAGIATAVGHFMGGNGIISVNGDVICSLGVNTTGGTLLTAGHCTRIVPAWNKENNGQFIGPSIGTAFPGTDSGLIRNDGTMKQRPTIQGYDAGVIPVTGAANAAVGEAVCKSGRTTQRTCGVVQAVNVTVQVNDGGQIVTLVGMTQTNVCVQPGDSGGPLYDGGTALGLTSAGSAAPCGTPGFVSFYEPMPRALSTHGVNILTA